MKAQPRDDPRPEWAKFDVERWRGSARYRSLSWQARLISMALFVWQSQKGPILDEDGDLSVAANGAPAGEVRAILERMSDFKLVDGVWIHPVAMAYYDYAVQYAMDRRKGAEKTNEKRWGNRVADDVAERVAQRHAEPSVSVSVSAVEEGEGSSKVLSTEGSSKKEPEQTALALVPIVEAEIVPPAKEHPAIRCARAYLDAMELRKGKAPKRASPGVLHVIEGRIRKRHSEGFEYEFLAALPALHEDSAFADGTSVLSRLFARPDALLGENAQRTGTHAARLRQALDGLLVSEKQKNILMVIGSWPWCESQGVRVKGQVIR